MASSIGTRQDRALEIVERNATALSRMVADVLDVSRIVAGKVRLNVQPIDLPMVVEEAIATVRPAAEAKGVRLQTLMEAPGRTGSWGCRPSPAGDLESGLECRPLHAS